MIKLENVIILYTYLMIFDQQISLNLGQIWDVLKNVDIVKLYLNVPQNHSSFIVKLISPANPHPSIQ